MNRSEKQRFGKILLLLCVVILCIPLSVGAEAAPEEMLPHTKNQTSQNMILKELPENQKLENITPEKNPEEEKILEKEMLKRAIPDRNDYSNGKDFLSDGSREYYINMEDEYALYCLDLQNNLDRKVLDAHVMTIFDYRDQCYLLTCMENRSQIIRFDMNTCDCETLLSIGETVTQAVRRNSILYYIAGKQVRTFDIKTGANDVLLTESQVSTLYFSDENTLKFYTADGRLNQYDFLSRKITYEYTDDIAAATLQESSYTPRLSAPARDNPYYTTWNVFYTSGYGMTAANIGNCTCYAYGRSYENLGTKPKLSTGNAGKWYDYNITNGYYKYGQTPMLGAVAVWSKTGGAGHVAVVEKIDGDNVITSESGWKSFYFKTRQRNIKNARFDAGSNYQFLGFIYVKGYLTDADRIPRLSITGQSIPGSLEPNKGFNLTGTVSTDCGVLTKVSASIVSAYTGQTAMTVSVTPISKSLDIRYSDINSKLTFGTLAGGKYVYILKAEAQNGTDIIPKELIRAEFTVGNPGYTLTFNANGGIDPPDPCIGISAIHIPTKTPVREGYVFQGWSKAENAAGTQHYQPGEYFIITANTTLYAVWSRSSYHIRFVTNTTEIILPGKTIGYGDTIPEPGPEEVYREGYLFDGWFTDAACQNCHDFNTPVYQATTLYAKWTVKQPNFYSIEYQLNGGFPIPRRDILKENDTVVQLADPERDGYRFTGWFTDDEARYDLYDFRTPVTADLILYAGWERIAYSVQFMKNDGLPAPDSQITQTVNMGDYASEPAAPTRENYTFIGWFTDETCTIPYNFNSKVEQDLILYAGWTRSNYNVQFVMNGGLPAPALQTVSVGTCVSEPAAPTREDYDFTGWFINEDLQNLYDFDTLVTADLILYAGWKEAPRYYLVQFQTGEGSPLPDFSILRGETVPEPDQPTLDGYIFTGWFTDKNCQNAYDFTTSVTADLILYAGWIKQEVTEDYTSYTIHFITNSGTELPASTVFEGQSVVEPAPPIREGYQFTGWFTDRACQNLYDFETPVTADLILYAEWKEPPVIHAVYTRNRQIVLTASGFAPQTSYACIPLSDSQTSEKKILCNCAEYTDRNTSDKNGSFQIIINASELNLDTSRLSDYQISVYKTDEDAEKTPALAICSLTGEPEQNIPQRSIQIGPERKETNGFSREITCKELQGNEYMILEIITEKNIKIIARNAQHTQRIDYDSPATVYALLFSQEPVLSDGKTAGADILSADIARRSLVVGGVDSGTFESNEPEISALYNEDSHNLSVQGSGFPVSRTYHFVGLLDKSSCALQWVMPAVTDASGNFTILETLPDSFLKTDGKSLNPDTYTVRVYSNQEMNILADCTLEETPAAETLPVFEELTVTSWTENRITFADPEQVLSQGAVVLAVCYDEHTGQMKQVFYTALEPHSENNRPTVVFSTGQKLTKEFVIFLLHPESYAPLHRKIPLKSTAKPLE